MMHIDRTLVDDYGRAIDQFAEQAGREAAATFDIARKANIGMKPDELRETLIGIIRNSTVMYGDMAGEIAAAVYDDLAERAGLTGLPEAVIADDDGEDTAIDELARYLAGQDDQAMIRRRVTRFSETQVRRRANRTMTANATRDHVRYARVPSGGRTCAFCAMLASRGFVYHSEQAAGADDKYHTDCHCRVMPGFDDTTHVDGYDPDALYADYLKARDETGKDAPTESDILAAMRRHEGMYTDGAQRHINVPKDWKQPRDPNDGRILSLRNETDTTDGEWYERQERAGVPHSLDTLYPQEIVFLERFQQDGNHVEWIPKDTIERKPTNDFRWIEQDELCELKSMTKADYGKIADRITRAVRDAKEKHGIVKDCFIVDLGNIKTSEKLMHQLAGYNSREWKIRRLFVFDGNGLSEIRLNV